jgi:hypothetical protein
VLDEAEQRWDEARRAASSKRSASAAVYLRVKRREIITDLAKKYSRSTGDSGTSRWAMSNSGPPAS